MTSNEGSKILKEKDFSLHLHDIAGLGQQCQIVFNLNTFFIKEVGHEIKSLTEFSSDDLVGRTIYYFLDSIVMREQLPAVNNFFNQSIHYIKEQFADQKIVNLDFGIKTMHDTINRLLFQFRNIDPVKGEQLAYGRVIDLSHFVLGGLPRLFVLERDGSIDGNFKADSDVLEQTGIDLSKKEINVLLLKSKGMRAK